MKAVVARVTEASVEVEGAIVGAIDEPGLLVLLGVHHDDTADQFGDPRGISEYFVATGATTTFAWDISSAKNFGAIAVVVRAGGRNRQRFHYRRTRAQR